MKTEKKETMPGYSYELTHRFSRYLNGRVFVKSDLKDSSKEPDGSSNSLNKVIEGKTYERRDFSESAQDLLNIYGVLNDTGQA